MSSAEFLLARDPHPCHALPNRHQAAAELLLAWGASPVSRIHVASESGDEYGPSPMVYAQEIGDWATNLLSNTSTIPSLKALCRYAATGNIRAYCVCFAVYSNWASRMQEDSVSREHCADFRAFRGAYIVPLLLT